MWTELPKWFRSVFELVSSIDKKLLAEGWKDRSLCIDEIPDKFEAVMPFFQGASIPRGLHAYVFYKMGVADLHSKMIWILC